LSFITYRNQVLLIRGAPHKRIWAGLYNGIGGHVESGEDILSSARREIFEETGLKVQTLQLCGIINAATPDPNLGVLLFIFRGEAVSQETTPSSEGTLEWFDRAHPPTEDVVEDLPLLLSRVLGLKEDDPPFFGAYTYDNQDRLVVTFS
jgi:8-oxo-dGTP diphosphatase